MQFVLKTGTLHYHNEPLANLLVIFLFQTQSDCCKIKLLVNFQKHFYVTGRKF